MSNSNMTISLAQLVRRGRLYWSSPAGRAHWQAERACIGPVCERLFGVHSLHLGMAPRLTDMCQIRHSLTWAPTRELAEDDACLVCDPTRLPLPDDSLSLVVVHHMLEVAPEPHRLLQEATRVMADNGCLIIFGWFPLGIEGARRIWPRSRVNMPRCGRWRTPGRLGDWLAFVDFEIERVDYCGFRLPGRLPSNAKLESIGRRYNLPFSDMYMIRARPKTQRAQIVRPGLTTPVMGRPLLGNSPRVASEQKRKQVSEVD
ncbi:methyltransferase domain-containing protein [Halomonas sp. GXIMD04776]|uniref:methyltransferase domain-containing protein n=1 Tax=Halomonas sp. GXIMD04776 TaxID=3415605 RepID=UPI003CB94E29